MQASKAPCLWQRRAELGAARNACSNRRLADSSSLFVSPYWRDSRETARFVLLNAVNDCEGPGGRSLKANSFGRNIPGWRVSPAAAVGLFLSGMPVLNCVKAMKLLCEIGWGHF
jgi:hypothetical protein